MEQLSPAYISALASQLATLSAFLGGFAATVLATLLTLDRRDRLATVAIGFAATSAVSFIVAVVAATMLSTLFHPAAPAWMVASAGAAVLPRALMSLGFTGGTLALLATIGCGGWTHSRAVGWTTTVAAVVGAVLIASVTVQIR